MATHSEATRNVHPPLQTEAAEARKERITWLLLGGFATGIVAFLALVHALGPVSA